MGVMDRLKRVTLGRIEAFLRTVEDPETVLDQLVSELEQRVVFAADSGRKARAAQGSAQRRLDESEGRQMRMARGARLALQQGDEQTAREALAQQIASEREIARQQKALRQSEEAADQAVLVHLQLDRELRELREKRELLLNRVLAAKRIRAAGVPGTLDARRTGLLDAVARMEMRVQESETQVEARREVSRRVTSLEGRLRELTHESEVNRRLDEIRKRSGRERT